MVAGAGELDATDRYDTAQDNNKSSHVERRTTAKLRGYKSKKGWMIVGLTRRGMGLGG
jgi:hypothetical protein